MPASGSTCQRASEATISDAAAATDLTVLVADDDDGVRGLVVIVLRRAGCTVFQAATGRQAVDVVRDRGDELDVVLLDVMMPQLNGREALPEIRRLVADLPIVVISGFDRNEVAEHLSAPTAYTTFLPKPFENAELVEEIRRAAAGRDDPPTPR